MNAKTNNKPLTIAEQIAALQAIAARSEKIMALVADDVTAIREADQAATESKNAADQASGQRNTIWTHVRNIAFKVQEVTADEPDTAAQVFCDVMDEFLNPKGGDAAEKVKLTTAGQYASTGRKMLTELLIVPGADLNKYREATVREVREAFKDAKVQARNAGLSHLSKALRYAAKHGTDEEYALIDGVVKAVTDLYNPIKARKDKTSKKAEAAREIGALQQQAPAEPAVLELAAQATGTVETNEDADNAKVAAV